MRQQVLGVSQAHGQFSRGYWQELKLEQGQSPAGRMEYVLGAGIVLEGAVGL